ncbi:ABC transporter permease [Verrucomicrobiota bacterium]
MIKIQNLRKTYVMGDTKVHALDGVSLEIKRGEYVAIVGSSGSGKSTLMHMLGLLDQPTAGTLEIDGTDVTLLTPVQVAELRNSVIGFVFQQFNLLSRTTALENVELPLLYSRRRKSRAACKLILEQVGLGDRADHRPNQLSGGQQQRVAVARALANSPQMILADEPTGNLDTKSEAEILKLFDELHAQGLTVIVVTHDASVAKNAERVITLRDGKVISDEHREKPVWQNGRLLPEQEGERHGFAQKVFEWKSLVRQSLRALYSNKVRTALSSLGIMIGVAAVIATVALGEGAKKSIQQELSRLGTNLLVLYPERMTRGGVRLASGEVSRLKLEDAEAIQADIEDVKRLSPTSSRNAQIKFGNKNWNSRIQGVWPAYAQMRNYEPAYGRFFTQEESSRRARVALIGYTPLCELFGEVNPIGKTIKINRQSFSIIGVLPEKGSSTFRDQDDIVIVPLETAMYRLFGRRHVDRVEIEIESASAMESAQEEIISLVERRHRTGTRKQPFSIRNMQEIQDTLTSTSRIMSVLLLSIATIALLVGGIGIMNIMLVSVTERTREIGLRKALGARNRDVMIQFLIESLAVSFIGGGIGIGLGALISLGMKQFAGWPVSVTTISVLIAFGFSAIVGVVFGLWPARKAAALDPIQALRYE